MSQAREAIKQDRYLQFVRSFFSALYHGDKSRYPTWAVDALKTVGIDLLEDDALVEQDNGA
jgi:queuine tRNA-ribosyltransferase catalytic subunit